MRPTASRTIWYGRWDVAMSDDARPARNGVVPVLASRTGGPTWTAKNDAVKLTGRLGIPGLRQLHRARTLVALLCQPWCGPSTASTDGRGLFASDGYINQRA